MPLKMKKGRGVQDYAWKNKKGRDEGSIDRGFIYLLNVVRTTAYSQTMPTYESLMILAKHRIANSIQLAIR